MLYKFDKINVVAGEVNFFLGPVFGDKWDTKTFVSKNHVMTSRKIQKCMHTFSTESSENYPRKIFLQCFCFSLIDEFVYKIWFELYVLSYFRKFMIYVWNDFESTEF